MAIHKGVTQLRQDRAELLDEIDAILDGVPDRELTWAEKNKCDAKIKAIDKIDADIKSAERYRDRMNQKVQDLPREQPEPQLWNPTSSDGSYGEMSKSTTVMPQLHYAFVNCHQSLSSIQTRFIDG